MLTKLTVVLGDITKQEVDAVVNAANVTLLGGGGVDGAIHKAAGPELLKECMQLGGCNTGDAKITGGYKLKAKNVIHTVGPVWRGGGNGEAELLASCYRSSLALAVEHNLKSVAFPSLSTGAFGFPIQEAAPIAVETVSDFLQDNPPIDEVRFVLFNATDLMIYQKTLRDHSLAYSELS